ncbi:RCC1 domain-containing protein DDB_G0279253-like [Physella acuta]|uniref:RCC1 domain-containing protein DDB_G0279253-like n=1 Tax=Physella acuta TaxID=109671 RepID=UPI0027DC4C00|nr:RCC1 domain-containing protein DDB_G0279253-like [Physella acuta]
MSVYTWGLGKNGQLGTGKAETSHTPQLLTKAFAEHPLHLVHQISCGALFTAIVTKNGNLYTCGCGKFGRLGLESKEEDTLMFTAVNLAGKLGKVNQVSCGSWHASAVTESGQIFI